MPSSIKEGSIFERWNGDATFSLRPDVEWIQPEKQPIYRVQGVVNCPDIARFELAHHGNDLGASISLFHLTIVPS
jgi:hypothetical protein